MLILICFSILLLIGVGFLIGGIIHNHSHFEIIWPHILGTTFISIAIITLLILGVDIAQIQYEKQLDYDQTLESYIIISNFAENYDQLSEHEKCLTLTNIKSYNDKIRESRYYKDNLWLSWFYNDLLAELPIIEYEGVLIE